MTNLKDFLIILKKLHIKKSSFQRYILLKSLKTFKIIYDFINFIGKLKTVLEIAKNQYLILKGEAGIGKSHLFADIIKNIAKNNQQSIFILGQHLIEQRSLGANFKFAWFCKI